MSTAPYLSSQLLKGRYWGKKRVSGGLGVYLSLTSPPPGTRPMAEIGSGEPAGGGRGPLQPAAQPAAGHGEQPGVWAGPGEDGHREAGAGVPDAAGHQDPPGDGDRRVQEAAWRGGRDVSQDSRVQSSPRLCIAPLLTPPTTLLRTLYVDCTLYVLALNVRTYCTLYVLALNVRTFVFVCCTSFHLKIGLNIV